MTEAQRRFEALIDAARDDLHRYGRARIPDWSIAQRIAATLRRRRQISNSHLEITLEVEGVMLYGELTTPS